MLPNMTPVSVDKTYDLQLTGVSGRAFLIVTLIVALILWKP
jgi:hypothetical protein